MTLDFIISDTFKKLFLSLLIIIVIATVKNVSAQENWVKYGDGPVLPRDTVYFPPSNDIYVNSDPFVIKHDNIYKMWFTCGGGNYPTDTLLRSRICYSTSNDGIHWTKWADNPVIDVSYDGNWDSLGIETICVIIDSAAVPSQRYKAWYAGQYYNTYRYDIGYAWSADGISWTKHGAPVLSVGSFNEWDNAFLEGPVVIKDGHIYKMWYAGYDLNPANPTYGKVNIGYATSSDGINWTKFTGNPVLLTSTSGWDMLYVQDPHVIYKNSLYHMWYGGVDTSDYGGYGQQTGYAYSNDGVNWTKSPLNPVLERGGFGSWDYNTASFPSVIYDENGWLKMWYTGRNKDVIPASFDYFWEIGLAIDSSACQYIAENIYENQISIFPNPAKNHLHLCHKQLFNNNYSVFIADIQGKMLLTRSFEFSDLCIEMDISKLNSGIYFIRIEGENMQLRAKLLVKE